MTLKTFTARSHPPCASFARVFRIQRARHLAKPSSLDVYQLSKLIITYHFENLGTGICYYVSYPELESNVGGGSQG